LEDVVSSRSVRAGLRLLAALATLALFAPGPAAAAPACPISYGSADDAKPNKLYLYYPTVADATFPEFGAVGGGPTSPATPFDTSLLTSYTGSAGALSNGINDVVMDDFCEFNVQVRPTATAPPATFPRRVTIAVGTNSEPAGRWGRANLVDTGDATDLGFARVWAGTYQNTAGFPGGALHGANSTVNRWARSIGGTAAHEGGHTYGLSHSTDTNPGEDAFTRHLMPAGSAVNAEHRAGYRRHFSDDDFSTLAANVGLSIQTMHNWDLINPNSQTGHRFRLTFLSPQSSPVMSWSYGGSLSPWSTPVLTANGTQSFNGTTYNRFRLTWSTDKGWSGGPNGQVPGGADFHIGATFSGVDFNQPDPIIITNSELLDDDGDPLPLKPRLPGYDVGTLARANGFFDLRFFNPRGPNDLRVDNVVVRRLPRVLSIDSMVPGGQFRDPFGEPLRPLGRRTVMRRPKPIPRKGRLRVRIARMSEERHILDEVDAKCDVSDSPIPGDLDAAACRPGFNASLFPSTTVLVTADVITGPRRTFDRRRKRFVRKRQVSRVYYQLGGIHPDLNKNRVDDAIDIEFGNSDDDNEDGVPDEAQRRRRR
jgi:hypothetical protein